MYSSLQAHTLKRDQTEGIVLGHITLQSVGCPDPQTPATVHTQGMNLIVGQRSGILAAMVISHKVHPVKSSQSLAGADPYEIIRVLAKRIDDLTPDLPVVIKVHVLSTNELPHTPQANQQDVSHTFPLLFSCKINKKVGSFVDAFLLNRSDSSSNIGIYSMSDPLSFQK